MKLEITLKDRLLTDTFYQSLKVSDLNIVNAIVLKNLQDKLKVTAKEIEKYDIREENNVIKWNSSITHRFKHEFTGRELEVLNKLLTESSVGSLSLDQIPEYITKIISENVNH